MRDIVVTTAHLSRTLPSVFLFPHHLFRVCVGVGMGEGEAKRISLSLSLFKSSNNSGVPIDHPRHWLTETNREILPSFPLRWLRSLHGPAEGTDGVKA